MLLLPIVVLRVHDLPLLEIQVRLGNVVRIKPVVELVEDGAAAAAELARRGFARPFVRKNVRVQCL